MRWRPVVAALAVIALANAAGLGLAWWNRTRQESVLALTERELAPPVYRDEEGSGLALRLLTTDQPPFAMMRAAWRHRIRLPAVDHAWLDRSKLRALGFPVDVEPDDPSARDHYAAAAARPLYLALELDGPAFAGWLAGREAELARARQELAAGRGDAAHSENLARLLELDLAMRSRLFPVDAGRNPDELRRRHPARDTVCVVSALVRVEVVTRPGEPAALRGRVLEVLPEEVDVPLALRGRFAVLSNAETSEQVRARESREVTPKWPDPAPPRYTATVAFGRNLEPWILEASPTRSTSPTP